MPSYLYIVGSIPKALLEIDNFIDNFIDIPRALYKKQTTF